SVSDESGLFTIAERDTINVLSPRGGETWYRFSHHDIQWSAGPDVGAGPVDLDYSTNGGTSWMAITSGIPIASGSYDWTLPDEDSSNCLVRVIQPSSGVSGQSPTAFTIAPPTFTVTSPSGGESWYLGDLETVTWTYTTGITGNVDIDYSTSGVSGPWAEIAANQPNSGSYPWTVPNDGSTTCRVRISEVGGISQPGISAADFTIIGVSPPSSYTPLGWKVMDEVDTECSIYSIEAYDNDKIWLGCGCGLVYYFNGNSWDLQEDYSGDVMMGVNVKEFIALSGNDVYGGGTGGNIIYYDGSYWDTVYGIGKNVYSMDGPDADHIMAGCAYGRVNIYDSGTWTSSSVGESASLYGCVYLKPNEAYVIRGGSDTADATVFASVDGGTTWPSSTVLVNRWGLGSHPLGGCIDQNGNTQLWAVGDCGLIMHYDGSTWSLQTQVGYTNWNCVEVLDENNVWVGGKSILHYNGSKWIVEVPEEDSSISTIYQISAVDSTHVYAIASSSSKKIYTTFVLPSPSPTPYNFKTPTPTPVPTLTPEGYKTPTPAPPSVICNNSFEESPDLTCWMKYGTTSSIKKSSKQHYDGSYSCLFDDPTGSYSGRGVFSDPIPVIAGEEYIFSGWYFVQYKAGEIGDTDLQFQIWWYEEGSPIYDSIKTFQWNLAEFDNWTEPIFTDTAPENADEVEIYISCQETVNNNNDVYIDYFNLTRPPGITVTAPEEGAVWYVGENDDITWNSVAIVNNIDIYSSYDNGSNWTQIAASISDTGGYTWTIPDHPGSQCLVRVQEAGSGTASDESGLFTIAARDSINLLSPRGGETWYQTSSYDIKWSAGPDVDGGNVDLDYSTDNGSNWTSIATGVAIGSGSYNWTIPLEDSGNCLVRVSQPSSGISCQSPQVFTITPPTFVVTSPGGGEYWYFKDAHNITWTHSPGITGNVNIDYSSTGPSGPWFQIAADQPDTGIFSSWTIPNISTSSARVRISEVGGIS
ncbi:MAG: hypothetical protein ACXQTN_05115, partial [Methanoculleaceae archaeon]